MLKYRPDENDLVGVFALNACEALQSITDLELRVFEVLADKDKVISYINRNGPQLNNTRNGSTISDTLNFPIDEDFKQHLEEVTNVGIDDIKTIILLLTAKGFLQQKEISTYGGYSLTSNSEKYLLLLREAKELAEGREDSQ